MGINMIFWLNTFFILLVNLLTFNKTIILSLIVILILLLTSILIVRNKKKKLVLICLGLLGIFFLNYNFRTIGNLKKNEVYQFQVDIISQYPRIIKINNKFTKEKYNINFDKTLEDGSYKVLGKVRGQNYNIENKNSDLYVKILEKKEIDNKINRNIKEKIEGLVGEFSIDFENFTKAVLLGERGELSSEVREKFNYTGTSHILVVSGLHIGIIILSILFILKKLPYQMRYIVTSIVLTLYCYGIGFTPSVLRAYIMGVVFLGAKIFYEERDMIKAIMIAFIVSSFINPYGIRSVSYQMSYLALVAILFLYPKVKGYLNRSKKYKKSSKFFKYIIEFLLLSFSIQIILSPIFLYNFRSLPLFSFIPNLIVIPIGSILVQALFTGLLLSYIGLGFILMPVSYYLYIILISIVNFFSNIPLLTLNFYTKISIELYIFLYIIIIFFILVKERILKKYWIIIILIVPLNLINLISRKENLDLPNDLGYYRTSPNKVLVLNKRLNMRNIYLLRDYKIRNLDYLITSYTIKNENIDIKKAYPNVERLALKEKEGIKLDNNYFYNEDGKIKKK